MLTSRHIEILAYNSVAALVGAAVMLVVLRSAMMEPAHIDRRDHRFSHGVQSSPRAADRLVFVKPGAVRLPAPADPELRPSLTPSGHPIETASLGPPRSDPETELEAEAPARWSTETHAAPAPPAPRRFQVLPSLRLPWQSAKPSTPRRPATLSARLAELSPSVSIRLAAKFQAAKAAWPPAEVAFVAIKDERAIELHARAKDGPWTLVHRYRVLAASGTAGPKLRQGDRQVPEGVYGIAFLNPNSAYHVSLRVNYPNAFDRQMAAHDGRKDLGGDIMIHGKNLSAGCLAMGDEAAEELFVLAAQVGLPHVKLVIAPTDFRRADASAAARGGPEWVPRLYADIAAAMVPFKPAPSKGLLSFFSK